jgi:hypothetical protein
VTFEITFEEKAISRAAGFLVDDPEGVRTLLDAVDARRGRVPTVGFLRFRLF